MILGFFAIDLAIAAIAITMAAGDPSFRSIPGYGERAVAWDERQALRDAWQQKKVTMDELWRAAEHCRVANVMRPYLESLV